MSGILSDKTGFDASRLKTASSTVCLAEAPHQFGRVLDLFQIIIDVGFAGNTEKVFQTFLGEMACSCYQTNY